MTRRNRLACIVVAFVACGGSASGKALNLQVGTYFLTGIANDSCTGFYAYPFQATLTYPGVGHTRLA
jgi:hypothetical protein